jgi:alpha-methylacyl-CoA racemase
VSAALALLLGRLRSGEAAYVEVALATVADDFAAPLRHGLIEPARLGGEAPQYGLYRTRDGRLAVAALEPRFRAGLACALGVERLDRAALAAVFASRTAAEWEEWGRERDLPLAAVRSPGDSASG